MRTNYGVRQDEIDQREGQMMQEVLLMKYENAVETEKEMKCVCCTYINHTNGKIYKVREIMVGRYSLWSDDGKISMSPHEIRI
jgi:hypothetical protein